MKMILLCNSILGGKISNKILICSLLLFVTIVFGIRCFYQEPIGDEVCYEYVWETDDPTSLWDENHRFERKVSNFNEIVQSQIIHYKIANGRSLVHAGEQAFTDNLLAFSIVNSLIWVGGILLIGIYCIPSKRRYWFPLWLIIVIILIYLFPVPYLWTSINLAPNYLWPSLLSVIMLLVWDRIETKKLKSRWLPLVILLSAIFGWTHEGFVIGVGGGIFVYYCFNIKKINLQILCLAIPMYVSGAIMVFSPGNIYRFFGDKLDTTGIKDKFINGLVIFGESILFWIFLLCFVFVIYTKGRKYIFDFIYKNLKLSLVIFTSIVFSLFANTLTHSISYVLFFLMLLFLKGLFTQNYIYSNNVLIGSFLIAIIFILNQIFIAHDEIKNFKFQHSVIERYKESESGVVEFNEPKFSFFTTPFIRKWNLNEIRAWSKYDIWNKAYSKGKKSPLFLYPDEYKVISDSGSFFIENNRIPGNANAYRSDDGQWIWIHPSNKMDEKSIQASLYPVDFNHKDNVMFLNRIKFALFPKGYSQHEILYYDTIITTYGPILRVHTPFVRKVSEVNFVDDVIK